MLSQIILQNEKIQEKLPSSTNKNDYIKKLASWIQDQKKLFKKTIYYEISTNS